ncbi:MAG: Clp protease N-terminal domain-containing protein [Nocardioidaceae bacterium]
MIWQRLRKNKPPESIPYTDTAYRALAGAREEARRLDQYWIGGAHLLLGLVHDEENGGVAATVLARLGLTREVAQRDVEEIKGRGPAEPEVPFPHSQRSARVMDLANRAAIEDGYPYITTGHLLLAMLEEGGGDMNQILSRYVTDPQAVREQVDELLQDPAAAGEPMESTIIPKGPHQNLYPE